MCNHVSEVHTSLYASTFQWAGSHEWDYKSLGFTFSRILLHSAFRLQTQSVSIQYIIAKKPCSQDGHGRIWLTSCLVFFVCNLFLHTSKFLSHHWRVSRRILHPPLDATGVVSLISPYLPFNFQFLSSWANCWIGFVGKVYRKKSMIHYDPMIGKSMLSG